MTEPCCYCDNNNYLNDGAWSKEDDQKLINHATAHSEVCWCTFPQASVGLLRCGKCCRKRWFDTLSSDHKREKFGEDEDDLIIRLHALLGDSSNKSRGSENISSGSNHNSGEEDQETSSSGTNSDRLFSQSLKRVSRATCRPGKLG
ncbi:Myb-related protein 308-like protein [Tanacetum coccineum]